MDDQGNYIERKFGHSKVRWNIGNYCVTPSAHDWRFYSPDFYVRGLYVTKWRMLLRRIFVREGEYTVKFELQRLDYGSSYAEALIDCSIEFSDHEGETMEIEFQYNFQVNSVYEKEFRNTSLTPIKADHSDDFHLKCEILVNFEGIVEALPVFDDIGVKQMSEDLLSLYLSGDHYDFQLSMDDDYIPAHKSILYYRISDLVFRNRIAQADDLLIVDDYSREGAHEILRFLYTGNLELALSNPVVSAYKFAELLDVQPVIAYYEPDEYYVASNICVEDFKITWTIEDLCNRKEYYIRSPQMSNENNTVSWYVKVHPKGYQSANPFLGVFMEIDAGEPTEICVEFIITDIAGRSIFHRQHKRIINKEIFGDKSFIKWDILDNYLVNGNLTVNFRLRMPTGRESLSLGKSKSYFEKVSVKACYERFVADILRMYEDQAYQDFRIEFQGHIAYLHKCVLSVRYPSLYIAFQENVDYFRAMKSKVVKAIFFFLYSGSLATNLSLEDTISLYEVANEFDVTTLKIIIVNKFLENLSETNVRRICQFAEAKNIVNLRDDAQKYIQDHCNG